MTVRDALPARTNPQQRGRQAAPAPVPVVDDEVGQQLAIIRHTIELQTEAFAAVLPAGTDPGRFARLVLTAVKATPKLVDCFRTVDGRTSLLLAAMQAASVGLEPNTPVRDGWILPRTRKIKGRNGAPDQWVDEAEWSISYRGLCKLMRRTGGILDVQAHPVREGDAFDYEFGLTDRLAHRPGPSGERGDLTHVWALARFTNSGYSFVVLDREQVEKRRAMSTSWSNERSRPFSPWTTWTDEMWAKTGLRSLTTVVEMSPELAQAVEVDEHPVRYDPWQQQLVSADPDPFGPPPAEAPAERESITVGGAPPPGPAPGPEGQEVTDAAQAASGPAAGPDGPDGPTDRELLVKGARKGLYMRTDGLGKQRAKLLAAAVHHLGTQYRNLPELIADGSGAAAFEAHLDSLPDHDPNLEPGF